VNHGLPDGLSEALLEPLVLTDSLDDVVTAAQAQRRAAHDAATGDDRLKHAALLAMRGLIIPPSEQHRFLERLVVPPGGIDIAKSLWDDIPFERHVVNVVVGASGSGKTLHAILQALSEGRMVLYLRAPGTRSWDNDIHVQDSVVGSSLSAALRVLQEAIQRALKEIIGTGTLAKRSACKVCVVLDDVTANPEFLRGICEAQANAFAVVAQSLNLSSRDDVNPDVTIVACGTRAEVTFADRTALPPHSMRALPSGRNTALDETHFDFFAGLAKQRFPDFDAARLRAMLVGARRSASGASAWRLLRTARCAALFFAEVAVTPPAAYNGENLAHWIRNACTKFCASGGLALAEPAALQVVRQAAALALRPPWMTDPAETVAELEAVRCGVAADEEFMHAQQCAPGSTFRVVRRAGATGVSPCVVRPRRQRYDAADAWFVWMLQQAGRSVHVPNSASAIANGEPFEKLTTDTALLFALLSDASRGYFEPADPTSTSTSTSSSSSSSSSSSALPKYKAAGIDTAAKQRIVTPPLRAYWGFRALLHVPGAKLVRRYDQLPFKIDYKSLKGVVLMTEPTAELTAELTATLTAKPTERDQELVSALLSWVDWPTDQMPKRSSEATNPTQTLTPEQFIAVFRHLRQFVGVEGNVAVFQNGAMAQFGDVIVLSQGKFTVLQCKNVQNLSTKEQLREFDKMNPVKCDPRGGPAAAAATTLEDVLKEELNEALAELKVLAKSDAVDEKFEAAARNLTKISDQVKEKKEKNDHRNGTRNLISVLRACCATPAIPADRVVVEFAIVSTHASLSMEERVVDGCAHKTFTTQAVVGDEAKGLEPMERSLLFPLEQNARGAPGP
jgi:hypothetical protein